MEAIEIGTRVDEAITIFHTKNMCDYRGLTGAAKRHLNAYFTNPLNSGDIAVQVPVSGTCLGLHIKGVIDQVREGYIWEVKYSTTNPDELIQMYASQVILYAHLSGLDVGGFINVRRQEYIRLHVVNVSQAAKQIAEMINECKRKEISI